MGQERNIREGVSAYGRKKIDRVYQHPLICTTRTVCVGCDFGLLEKERGKLYLY